MKPENTTSAQLPSSADCAEAAAWIAKLHGEDRSVKVEAGYRRWLAASATHRMAAEMATDLWTSAERLPKPAVPPIVRWPRAAIMLTLPRAVMAVAAVLVVVVAPLAYYYGYDPGISTSVGEQRNVTLEDGTRVALNTATRIRVRYDKGLRRVVLDRGEALFEVAKNPKWPFVVTAGNEQVLALGTSFVVRREEQALAVTLVEGKVTVSGAGTAPNSVLPSTGYAKGVGADAGNISFAPHDTQGTAVREGEDSRKHARSRQISTQGVFTLSPGERLTFARDDAPRVDNPPIDKLTAWQRGQIILDHTPLHDAVTEMNRYSDTQLELADAPSAAIQVTGIFRIGDSADFAQAVAATYGLKIIQQDHNILLTGSIDR